MNSDPEQLKKKRNRQNKSVVNRIGNDQQVTVKKTLQDMATAQEGGADVHVQE